MIQRFAALVALLAALTLAPSVALTHEHMHHDAALDAPALLSDRSLYNLESKWTTQDGATVALDSLKGQPVVTTMGYTTCKDICPAIVADMMWVEKHLPAAMAGRVRFAFFSIDPAVDTPAKLKAYADDHGLAPQSWTFFHGDDDAVRELAAALGIGYRADGKGGFDHAAVISLLNPKGEIVFQQRGVRASSEDLLAKLVALAADDGAAVR